MLELCMLPLLVPMMIGEPPLFYFLFNNNKFIV
jgi:hypothetical protein